MNTLMDTLGKICRAGVAFGASLLVSACSGVGGIPVLLNNVLPTVPALTAPATPIEHTGLAADIPNTGTSPLTACALTPESATQMFPSGITLGLSPDGQSCRISGVATGLTEPMMLEVSIQATNAVGSSEPISFTITFRSAPVVSNIDQAQTFTQNTEITPVVFTSTAGAPNSDDSSSSPGCRVFRPLPQGLRISLTDNGRGCQITGTPTAQSDNDEYTVIVTNTIGTVGATVSFAVLVDPSLALTIQDESSREFVLGQLIDPIVFSRSGADANTCTSTSLPDGLAVSTVSRAGGVSCQITGTPASASLMVTSYTVTATSSAGVSDDASVIITVFGAPVLANIATPVSFTVNRAAASGDSVVFPATGGLVSSCESSPALPVGLLVTPFGNACRISGTPTMLATVFEYTITASNAVGSVSAAVMIAVADIDLGLEPRLDGLNGRPTFILNSPIAEDIALLASGGAVSSCTAAPALPMGLILTPLGNTCVISGTPMQSTGGLARYRITAANDTNQTSTADIIIIVQVFRPGVNPGLMDITEVQSLPLGAVIEPIVFPVSAAVEGMVSCAPGSSTPLPMGLVVRPFDDTCAIFGTPVAPRPTASYTIVATNDDVSVAATVMIEIAGMAPPLLYAIADQMFVPGVALSTTISNGGGAPGACQFVNPDNNALAGSLGGLDIVLADNANDCMITGMLTSTDAQEFTVRATNVGGFSEVTLLYVTGVAASEPNLSNHADVELVVGNTTNLPISFANAGGAPTTCEQSSPTGGTGNDLSDFNLEARVENDTCIIAIPDSLPAGTIAPGPGTLAKTRYEITASDGVNTSTATVDITVRAPHAPTLTAPTTDDLMVSVNDDLATSPIIITNTNTETGAEIATTSCILVNGTDTTTAAPVTGNTFQGLSVDTNANTCRIIGTPTTVGDNPLNIRATSTEGAMNILTVTVVVAAATEPNLSNHADVELVVGNTINLPISFANAGGVPTTCEQSSPTGGTGNDLSDFNLEARVENDTCIIAIPDSLPAGTIAPGPGTLAKTRYEITASDGVNTSTATVDITVRAPHAPTLVAPAVDDLMVVVNADLATSPIIITNTNTETGAEIAATSCILVNGTDTTTAMPVTGNTFQGLSVDTNANTCRIIGTPTTIGDNPLNIRATSTDGAMNILTVTVVVAAASEPNLSNHADVELVVGNTTNLPISFANAGGVPTTCEQSSPTGGTGNDLSDFNLEARVENDTCIIAIPDSLPAGTIAPGPGTLAKTRYEITASDGVNTSTATVDITVRAPHAPTLTAPTTDDLMVVVNADLATNPIIITNTNTETGAEIATTSCILVNGTDTTTAMPVTGNTFQGLSVDTNANTCRIIGTPTTVGDNPLNIRATSTDGAMNILTVTVVVAAASEPNLSNHADVELVVGNTNNLPISFTNAGGVPTTCEQSSPTGGTGNNLSDFNLEARAQNNTCIIAIPDSLPAGTIAPGPGTLAKTRYEITASDGVNTSTATVDITVRAPHAPTLTAPTTDDLMVPVNADLATSPIIITNANTETGAEIATTSCILVNGTDTTTAMPVTGNTFQGLSVDTNANTCRIIGTPTTVGDNPLNIRATSTEGAMNILTVTVVVADIAPAITIDDTSARVFVTGMTITAIGFTNSGGAIAMCTVSPLPAGLMINPTTCEITGTPTVAVVSTDYTITATNDTDTSTATVDITVRAPHAPTLTAPTTDDLMVPVNADLATSPIIITNANTETGAEIATTSCILVNGTDTTTAMPVTGNTFQGLSVDTNANTCRIIGTPTTVGDNPLNIRATSTEGAMNILTVTVVVAAATEPNLSNHADVELVVGNTNNLPISFANAGGVPTTCEQSSPTGGTGNNLSDFNLEARAQNNTCIIAIPDSLPAGTIAPGPGTLAKTRYEITASNGAGMSTAIVDITVRAAHAPTLTAPTTDDLMVSVNDDLATSPIIITNANTETGAEIATTSCILVNGTDTTTAAPVTGNTFQGLSVDTNANTCRIIGTATTVGDNPLNIRATSTDGAMNILTVTVVVADIAPAITIDDTSDRVFVTGMTITAIGFTNSGGAIAMCTINSPLPAGLTINPTTCEITGTPTVAVVSTDYTITATNDTDTSTATVDITVRAPHAPTLTAPTTDDLMVPVNADLATSPIIITNANTETGAEIAATSCILVNGTDTTTAMPVTGNTFQGLSVDTNANTCRIIGTPTTIGDNPLNIRATSTDGAMNILTVTVVVAAASEPNLSNHADVELVVGNTINLPISFANAGGVPTTCEQSSPTGGTGNNLSDFNLEARAQNNTCIIAIPDSLPAGTIAPGPGTLAKTRYEITATNGAGMSTAIVDITVRAAHAPTLTAPTTDDLMVSVNDDLATSPIIITNTNTETGAEIATTSCILVNGTDTTTAMPVTGNTFQGLSVDTNANTCRIIGTPTTPGDNPLNIRATSTDGAMNILTVTVVVAAASEPNLSNHADVELVVGNTTNLPISFTNAGGAPTTCEQSSPTGGTGNDLSDFNLEARVENDTCIIAIPDSLPAGTIAPGPGTLAKTRYEITASDGVNTSTATVDITVRAPHAPTLTAPTTDDLMVPVNADLATSPIIITNSNTETGAEIAATSCILVNGTDTTTAAPVTGNTFQGLSVDTNANTCRIIGTPTITGDNPLNIRATSTDGAMNILTVTVVVAAASEPNLSNHADVELVVGNTNNLPISFTNAGGVPTTCEQSSPTGGTGNNLSDFNLEARAQNDTCIIAIPDSLPAGTIAPGPGTLAKTRYEITASNGAGMSTAIVDITVRAAHAPTLTAPTTDDLMVSVNDDLATSPIIITNTNTETGAEIATTSCILVNGTDTTTAMPVTGNAVQGLSVDTNANTCRIIGTPTTIGDNPLNIRATSTDGAMNILTVTVVVADIAPAITIDDANARVFVTGMTITAIGFTNSGGAIAMCTVSPLPAGLMINPTTCEITGNPTVAVVSTDYTITASDGVNTSTATVDITVRAPHAPTLTAPTTDDLMVSVNDDLATSPIIITNANTETGAEIATTSCILVNGTDTTTAMPVTGNTFQGLSVDTNANTCRIIGTPTTVGDNPLNIRATSTEGAMNILTVTVVVADIAPAITIDDTSARVFVTGMTITAIGFTNSGGAIAMCTVSPLPAGLMINPTTCEITGNPTVAVVSTDYTITASDGVNTSTATVDITVRAPHAPTLTAPTTDDLMVPVNADLATSPIIITNANTETGAEIATTSCILVNGTDTTTAMPVTGNTFQGLSVDTNANTCRIIGTPTTPGDNPLNIRATSTEGAMNILTVTVVVAAATEPNLSNHADVELVVGNTINLPISFANAGGVPTTCEQSSPTGGTGNNLSDFNLEARAQNNTCIIAIPDSLPADTIAPGPGTLAETRYEITASNGAGMSTAIVDITVRAAHAPTLTAPTTDDLMVSVNDDLATSPIIITNANTETGAEIATTSCILVNGTDTTTAMPVTGNTFQGLSVDTNANTCRIIGTPTTVGDNPLNIRATSTDGAMNILTVTVVVADIAPAITIDDASARVFVTGMTITAIGFTNSGGAIAMCTVSPLPAGLMINPTTCEITGNPTVAVVSTDYTITASDGVNTSTATVDITVRAPHAPTLTAPTTDDLMVSVNDDLATSPIIITNTNTETGAEIATTSCILVNGTDTTTAAPVTGNTFQGLSVDTNANTCRIIGTPTTVGDNPLNIRATSTDGAMNILTVTVVVADIAPAITIDDASDRVFVTGMTITAIGFTNSGGAIAMCTVSPLPAGLMINPTTCEITGNPTTVTSLDTYTITASDGTNMSSAMVTITVRAPHAPTLTAPTTDDLMAPVNTDLATSPIIITNSNTETGAEIAATSCILVNGTDTTTAMPVTGNTFQGLSVDTDANTCRIIGTPTTVGDNPLNIRATSTDGAMNILTVTVVVADIAPAITIDDASARVFVTGMTITAIGFTNSGGAIAMCTVSPLPAGLMINPTTCEITGNPTVAVVSTDYTITASDGTNMSSAMVTITVRAPQAPTLVTPAADDLMVTVNDDLSTSPIIITNSNTETGAEIAATSCILVNGTDTTTAMPVTGNTFQGLSVDTNANTCRIIGTPTTPGDNPLNIRATSTDGLMNILTVTVVVADIAPVITIDDTSARVFVTGMTITAIGFSSSGGAIAMCTVSPLPAGLMINPTTCEITGNPTTVTSLDTYTITATNDTGMSTAMVAITVRAPQAPTLVTPTADDLMVTVNADLATSPIIITNANTETGAEIAATSCVLVNGTDTTTAMPVTGNTFQGLSVDTNANTCRIIGTPTTVGDNPLNIRATSTDGLMNILTVTVVVADIAPVITIDDASARVFVAGMTITAIGFTNSGGAIAMCTVSPLPAGLMINPTTCEITGTPSTATSSATYTITATNGAGMSTAIVDITVEDVPVAEPNLSNHADVELVVGNTNTNLPISFNNTGGAPTTCEQSSPTGGTGNDLSDLNLEARVENDTCVIAIPDSLPAGTIASGALSRTRYEITATNATGMSTATVDITVEDTTVAEPDLSNHADVELVVGNTNTNLPISFNNTGGAPTTCEQSSTIVAASGGTGNDLGDVNLEVRVENDTCVIAIPDNLPAGTIAPGVLAETRYEITATNATDMSIGVVNITVRATQAPRLVLPIPDSLLNIFVQDDLNTSRIVYINDNIQPGAEIAASSCVLVDGTDTTTAMPVAGNAVQGLSVVNQVNSCAIIGRPTTAGEYTLNIRATSTDGLMSILPVTFMVSERAVPNLLNHANVVLLIGDRTTNLPIVFESTGTAPTNCELSSFSSTGSGPSRDLDTINLEARVENDTCVIAIPDSLPAGTIAPGPGTLAETKYDVTATNDMGTSTAFVRITVRAPHAPTLVVPATDDLMVPVNTDLSTSPIIITNANTETGAEIAATSCILVNGTDTTTAMPVTGNAVQGLSIDTNANTCRIIGTPTTVGDNPLNIRATSTDGLMNILTVTVVVADIAPVITIDDASARVFVAGMTITAIGFTNSGGAIAMCTVSPLPAGLMINSTTCEITGTPSTATSSATYTITASNDTDMSTAIVDITVEDVPVAEPNLSNHADVELVVGNTNTNLPISFNNTGGAPTTCEQSSPTGGTGNDLSDLNLEARVENDTCVIAIPDSLPAGTIASGVLSRTRYEITATNATGMSTATVDITVEDTTVAEPDLSNHADVELVVGNTNTNLPISFNNTGGAPTTCEQSSTIVAASGGTGNDLGDVNLEVRVENDTCVIAIPDNLPAGTIAPGVLAETRYEITATNATDMSIGVVNITVRATQAPRLVLPIPDSLLNIFVQDDLNTSRIVYINDNIQPGAEIAASSCVLVDGTDTTTAMPVAGNAVQGLSVVNQVNSCAIIGRPTTAGEYTLNIRATSTDGLMSILPVTFMVSERAVPNLLNHANVVLLIGDRTTNLPIVFESTGTAPTNCELSSFSSTGSGPSRDLDTINLEARVENDTCVIAIPDSLPAGAIAPGPGTLAETKYDVTATNDMGTSTAFVRITVRNSMAPVITIDDTRARTFVTGSDITAIGFTNSGGTIAMCTAAPTLPLGLMINSTTCEITGTPSTATSSATYTITATNNVGPNTATVDITVRDLQAPILVPVNPERLSDIFVQDDLNTRPIIIANDNMQPGGAIVASSCVLVDGTDTTTATPIAGNAFQGLSVDTQIDSCAIIGRPTTAGEYTLNIRATSTDGLMSILSVTFMVSERAGPNLLNFADVVLTVGNRTNLPIVFENTGTAPTNCELSSFSSTVSGPSGDLDTINLEVRVENDTCVIAIPEGLPAGTIAPGPGTLATTRYDVTAINDTDMSTAFVRITVRAAQAPILVPVNPERLSDIFVQDDLNTRPIVIANDNMQPGGAIVASSCVLVDGTDTTTATPIAGNAFQGLSVDTQIDSCAIIGRPTTAGEYTLNIRATSTEGAMNILSVTFMVSERVMPNLLNFADIELIVGDRTTNLPIVFENTGTAPTNCELSSFSSTVSGPSGDLDTINLEVRVENDTCVIAIPEGLPAGTIAPGPGTLATTRYDVTAINDTDMSTAFVRITVRAATPGLAPGLSPPDFWLSKTLADATGDMSLPVASTYHDAPTTMVPALVSVADTLALTANVEATPIVLDNTGANPTSCALDSSGDKPLLPAGLIVSLDVDNTSCQIGGFPTTPTDINTYTVTASNAAGVSSATVTFSIEPAIDTIAAGDSHSCAITSAGELYCWGSGNFGKLGLGTLETHTSPQRVGTDSNWQSVAVAEFHTCAIKAGELYCWGGIDSRKLNSDSMVLTVVDDTTAPKPSDSSSAPALDYLLLGSNELRHSTVPQRVGTDSDWWRVSTAKLHTCAIKFSGQLYCWGSAHPALGLGGSYNAPTPTQVSPGTSWRQVSTSTHHTCAINTNYKLFCWGSQGNTGRLGVRIGDTSHIPVAVTLDGSGASLDWLRVSTGLEHTCAITNAGSLYCWGVRGALGQVGVSEDQALDHNRPAFESPQRVGNESNWQFVEAGQAHTCATNTNDEIYCWGLGAHGQLGLAQPQALRNQADSGISGYLNFREYEGSPLNRLTPHQLDSNNISWHQVSSGAYHTCALSNDGASYCWGLGSAGNLGSGATNNANRPQPIRFSTTPQTP